MSLFSLRERADGRSKLAGPSQRPAREPTATLANRKSLFVTPCTLSNGSAAVHPA